MQTIAKNQPTVNGLRTARNAEGLELLILPGENAAAVLGSVEDFLSETERRPWIGFGDEPQSARHWSGAPETQQQEFYHRHGCDCPRCQKAAGCQVTLHSGSIQSAVVAYRITTPAGKQYLPTINVRSEVIQCNCPNGQHLYRATCYHAQAAWLEYITDDTRRNAKRSAALAKQF